jgi:CheY-like chemotaxis protein
MRKIALIVENNPLFRRFLEDILRQNCPAYDFIFAESAGSAMQITEQLSDLRVLVSDHNLGAGQTNGFELAEQIKTRHPQVQIIIISSSVDEALSAEAKQRGILHCVPKFNGLYEWISLLNIL